MDNKLEIKQEDRFSGDLTSQNEREPFHKVITMKPNRNAGLPDDNGCDMALKTEIESETSFPERQYVSEHYVKQTEFETVTCRNYEIVTETKIEEQALDSDFGSYKGTEFNSELLMKTANYNSDHQINTKIEVKAEPWWLETETSAACNDIKDEDFPPVTSSRLYTEAASGGVSDKSSMPHSEVSGKLTGFCNGKDPLEFEHQKIDVIEMPTTEEYILSEQYGQWSEGEQMYTRPLFLKQKTSNHQGKRLHQCTACDKSFTRLSYLKTHNMIHEGKKPYQCTSCGKSFIRSSDLNKHCLIHEGKKPHKCKSCSKSFTQLSHLKTHNLIHEGKKPHQCKTCNKSFLRLSNLKTHILIHEGKKPHKCKTCNKSFTHLSSLNKHNLIHEGRKPYKCKSCDKSFTHLSSFNKHNLIHEGKKPYRCKSCGKSFTQTSHLKTHTLIHEGKKPYKCKTCDKNFTQLIHLKTHLLIHKDN